MIITKTVTRILFPIIILYGIYIGSQGHLGPGGAFPAGVIVASAFLMIYVTHSKVIYPEHHKKDGLTSSITSKLKEEYLISSEEILSVASIVIVGLIFLRLFPALLERTPGEFFSALEVFGPNVGGTFSIAAELVIIIICFLPRRVHD